MHRRLSSTLGEGDIVSTSSNIINKWEDAQYIRGYHVLVEGHHEYIRDGSVHLEYIFLLLIFIF